MRRPTGDFPFALIFLAISNFRLKVKTILWGLVFAIQKVAALLRHLAPISKQEIRQQEAGKMHRVQKLIIPLAFALGAYFGLTWFFFGSSHPCGILETRQKPYVLEQIRTTSSEERKLALELIISMEPDALEAGTKILESLEGRPERALRSLHERVWRNTPAKCLWGAVAWDPDPYKTKQGKKAN